ncbi:MAG: histidine kinase [Gemmatimonadaceae bacterium]
MTETAGTSGISASRWMLLLAGWSAFGLVQASMRIALIGESGNALLSLLAFDLPLAWTWAFLTPLVGRWSRLVERHATSAFPRLVAHLPFMLLAMVLHTIVRRSLIAGFGQPTTVPFGVTLLYFADITIASYIAAVWIARALESHHALLERTRRTRDLEAQLTEAQMEYLQLQLRPHFLFNTLSSVAELGHAAPHVARRTLGSVISLLESAIHEQGPGVFPLGDEIETLSHYLDIERLRFSDWLTIDEDVEDAARYALVPPFILQPLVENAVQHGLLDRNAPGRITIRARVVADRLRVQIIDNGVGLTGQSYHQKRGLGLSNVRARLEALYGDDATLELQGAPGGGTASALDMPMRFAALADETSKPAEMHPASTETEAFAEVATAGIRYHPVLTAIAAWSIVGALRIYHSYTYMSYRGRFTPAAFNSAIGYDLSMAGLWLVLTPLVFFIARLIPLRRHHAILRMFAHAVAGFLIAFIHASGTQLLTTGGDAPLLSPGISEVFAWNVSVYVFLLLVAHIGEVKRWIENRDLGLARLAAEIGQAKFQKLMLELRPGVLIDALRHIEHTIESEAVAAEEQLAIVAHFLRRTLDSIDHRLPSLRDEIENCRSYLAVLAVGTETIIDLRVDAADGALDRAVPGGVLRAGLETLVTPSTGATIVGLNVEERSGSLDLRLKSEAATNVISGTSIVGGNLDGYVERGLVRIAHRTDNTLRLVVRLQREEERSVHLIPSGYQPARLAAVAR